MRETKASFTAQFVALCRGLGHELPRDAQLVNDRFGPRFATGALSLAAGGFSPVFARVARTFLVYMQVRTRTIDDVVREFVEAGGDQLVILGAGFDCRAVRMKELKRVKVYEIDHPATQAHKRAVLEKNPVTYVAWDFEQRPVSELPAALAELGHDPKKQTLTIWEGVTMYLSEPAIDATVAAVAAYSSPTSPFVFNYLDKSLIDRPSTLEKVLKVVVKNAGEPFTFGFVPDELMPWLEPRGFDVEWNKSLGTLASELLPASRSAWMDEHHRFMTLTRRRPNPA
jgi:methyltransferase (TIGR00027 family)